MSKNENQKRYDITSEHLQQLLKTKPDWQIMLSRNGMECENCGAVSYEYIDGVAHATTYGLESAYQHPEFELVLNLPDNDIGYLLNLFGRLVREGIKFEDGMLIGGVFMDCDVRIEKIPKDNNLLRIVIPDGRNRWPKDKHCDPSYAVQAKPMDELTRTKPRLGNPHYQQFTS